MGHRVDSDANVCCQSDGENLTDNRDDGAGYTVYDAQQKHRLIEVHEHHVDAPSVADADVSCQVETADAVLRAIEPRDYRYDRLNDEPLVIADDPQRRDDGDDDSPGRCC